MTAAEADGRKVYTITEQGRSFLAAGGPRVAEIDQRLRGWMGPFDRREYRAEIEGIQDDLQGMAQALREAGSRANPERLRRCARSSGGRGKRRRSSWESRIPGPPRTRKLPRGRQHEGKRAHQ